MVRTMTLMEAENLPPDALLRWYLEAGVDEAVGEDPLDRYALSAAQAKIKSRERKRKGGQEPEDDEPF